MKNTLLLFLSLMLIFPSCETSEKLDYASLEATTGLNLTDANGSPIGFLDSPNDYNINGSVFPNPSNGIFFIFVPDGITDVWIVPSECASDFTTNIPALITQVAYDIADIEQASELYIDLDNTQNNLTIDISMMSRGTYKVFFRLSSGLLQWSSIYIDPSQSSFPDPASINYCE